MATGPSPFVITESSMALRLGVDRNWLREHRGEPGHLWDFGANRQVLYAENAMDALASILDPKSADGPSLPPQPEKPLDGPADAAVSRKTEVSTLTVTRCRWLNRRVMSATDENGGVVTVWVLDSRLFRPGMKVLGHPRPARTGVFDFAGNPENPEAGPRLPRRPGMW